MTPSIIPYSEIVVGLVEASGPKDAVNPGWWIDSKYRGQGIGGILATELAIYLRELGYYDVENISIQTYQGTYDQASRKLKSIFIQTLRNG